MAQDRVFISYSGDRADRLALHEALREHGLRPWRDVEDLDLGAPTAETIEAELADCGGAVLWISEAFVSSTYVQRIELPAIARARLQRGIRIVPAFDGLSPNDAAARVATTTGIEIGDNNGHEVNRKNPTDVEAAIIAGRYALAHVRAVARNGERPIVRAVTRDDVAPSRDDATLNFDWRHHYERSALPAPEVETRLRDALATSTAHLKSAFAAGHIDLALKTHLHVGVAVGHAFRRTTGFVPRMHKDEALWEADVVDIADGDALRKEESQRGPVDSNAAAVEVAVSRSTTDGVNQTIADGGRRYARRVTMTPASGPGQTALSDAATANCWARHVADEMADLIADPSVREIDLFLATPLELAVLIGWWLNAAGPVHLQHWVGNRGPYKRSWTLPVV